MWAEMCTSIESDIAATSSKINKLRIDGNNVSNELLRSAAEIAKLQEAISNHNCMFCNQEIAPVTHDRMKRDLELCHQQESENKLTHQNILTEINLLNGQLKEFEIELAQQVKNEKLQQETKRLETRRDELSPLVVGMDDLIQSRSKSEQDLKDLKNTMDLSRQEQYKIKSMIEVSEKMKQLSSVQTKAMQQLSSKRKDTQKDIDEKIRQESILEFWERAFDRRSRKSWGKNDSKFVTMRSHLLERSIKDLNSILEEYSNMLGSNSLDIKFDSDLMVTEEYGKRSAGQRKRNQLVIFFALFELVRQRSRFRANFLMLDEVFDALDAKGQESVKNVIDMLSKRISKVFIITHSPSMGRHGHNIKAVMGPKGTQYNY
ncbi:hypothetical protein AKO1_000623 [Acrasis kona]|uniref:RecF/RecN/SMC N-terminal domain-containing protein n=1 Tax=Acrasis kona TaxID=1008807 RepID=A0AAW2ZRJ6_9EUKA